MYLGALVIVGSADAHAQGPGCWVQGCRDAGVQGYKGRRRYVLHEVGGGPQDCLGGRYGSTLGRYLMRYKDAMYLGLHGVRCRYLRRYL